MGECAYYIKARFKSSAAASEAVEYLNSFIEEGKEAFKYYQDIGRTQNKKRNWDEFEQKFPKVTEYAKTLDSWRVDFNKLSGKLDFGQEGIEWQDGPGEEAGYCDYSIWHFADWQPWAEWIKQKFEARKVVWTTEENGCGSLESLNLYDWEGMVQKILENKEALPLLLGMHEDLDELIEEKLK